MSVFARADVAGVSVSPEHGGCGQFHGRPVVQGAPVALWELSCPPCEDHLRSDDLWSANVSKIPETPDEIAAHEDWQRRSEKDTQFLLALTLAKMAGQPIPESMLRQLSGQVAPAAISGAVLCPDGHENAGGARFCSECGASMSAPKELTGDFFREGTVPAAAKASAIAPGAAQASARNAASAGPVEDADVDEPAAADSGEDSGTGQGDGVSDAPKVKLEALPLSQLKALAQQAGVAVARSKADQIAALRAAGF